MSPETTDRDRVRQCRRQAHRGTLSSSAIRFVIDQLSAEAVRTRRDAAVTLSNVAADRPSAVAPAVEDLRDRLLDEDHLVQQKAALALARIAEGDAVPVRLEAIGVRLVAADASVEETVQTLRQVARANPGVASNVAALLAGLLTAPDQSVREKAALGLAELADAPGIDDALRRSRDVLTRAGPDRRENAVRGLAVVVANYPDSPTTAIELLVDRLADPSRGVRNSVVEALDGVGNQHRPDVRATVRDLIDWLVDEKHDVFEGNQVAPIDLETEIDCRYGALGFVELATSRPDLVPAWKGVWGLATLLTDDDPGVVTGAASGLVGVATDYGDQLPSAMIFGVLGRLPTEDDPAVRHRVADVVVELAGKRPRAVHEATGLLSEAIAADEPASIAEPYARLLTHPSDEIREDAAFALVTRARERPAVVAAVLATVDDDDRARRAIHDAVARAEEAPDWASDENRASSST